MKEIIKKAREYALAEIEKYGTPYIEHFYLSEEKGQMLAEALKADKDIVKLGTYFMDLKIGQAWKENRLDDHIAMSIEAAKEFFEQFTISDDVKNKVLHCIEAHHATVPFKTIEAEVCANADCYRFLHPRGFLGYFMLSGSRKMTFEQALEMSEKKLDEKWGIVSLDICKKELEPYYKILKQLISDSTL